MVGRDPPPSRGKSYFLFLKNGQKSRRIFPIFDVREHDASPTFLIFVFANHDGMIVSNDPGSNARGIW